MRLQFACLQQGSTHRGLQHSHQDSSLQSVPRNVSQVRDGIAIRQAERIDKVAANFVARLGYAVDLEARRSQSYRRHQRLLDAVRQLQFIAHSICVRTLPADKANEQAVGQDDKRKYCDGRNTDALRRGHLLQMKVRVKETDEKAKRCPEGKLQNADDSKPVIPVACSDEHIDKSHGTAAEGVQQDDHIRDLAQIKQVVEQPHNAE